MPQHDYEVQEKVVKNPSYENTSLQDMQALSSWLDTYSDRLSSHVEAVASAGASAGLSLILASIFIMSAFAIVASIDSNNIMHPSHPITAYVWATPGVAIILAFLSCYQLVRQLKRFSYFKFQGNLVKRHLMKIIDRASESVELRGDYMSLTQKMEFEFNITNAEAIVEYAESVLKQRSLGDRVFDRIVGGFKLSNHL